jgi:hypothetical protein
LDVNNSLGQSIRTRTIYRDKSPLWGEEYYLKIENPGKFRGFPLHFSDKEALTVKIFDEESHSKDEFVSEV